MTVDEARKLLAPLPGDALFCASDAHRETIWEITKIELIPVDAAGECYVTTEDGAIDVAVVA
jgi:hypothetical protein